MTPFKKRYEKAKREARQAEVDYRAIKDSCLHEGPQTWKSKAGTYYCEDCERFLPRPLKEET